MTYMFSDTGSALMRLLSNMLWLWAFGYILQELSGNDKIIPIYIYGGLAGGLFFILANYLVPPLREQAGNNALFGDTAGTMAVAMATTTLSPNYRFFTCADPSPTTFSTSDGEAHQPALRPAR